MSKKDHPIKVFREAKGLTLRDLAARLNVAAMTVSRWENGHRMPRPKDWPQIAMVTGVTPAELADYMASKTEART